MKVLLHCKILLLVLLCGLSVSAQAQTVIDLQGGGVRSKTVDDYREDLGQKERAKTDSLAYIDHLTRAFNALHEDSLAEAERLFLLALKTRPEAPGNYIVEHYLGRIYLGTGRYRDAIERLNAVLSHRPEMMEARLDRAVCYYELNSLKAASDDCTALLSHDLPQKTRIRVLFLRSAIYSRSKQPALARADLENILRADPENESAALLLARCLEDLRQPQAALNHLNLYLSAHPKSADGFVARAQLNQRLGMAEAALADYDAAIVLSPQEADFYVARAMLKIELKKMAAARADLDKAVSLGVSRGELTKLYKQVKE